MQKRFYLSKKQMLAILIANVDKKFLRRFNMADEENSNNEVGGIAADRLRSLIERIERLEEEKAAIGSDIRDVYAEAKSAGFDVKIMRAIIKLRKMNAADRDEQEYLLDVYKKALDI